MGDLPQVGARMDRRELGRGRSRGPRELQVLVRRQVAPVRDRDAGECMAERDVSTPQSIPGSRPPPPLAVPATWAVADQVVPANPAMIASFSAVEMLFSRKCPAIVFPF